MNHQRFPWHKLVGAPLAGRSLHNKRSDRPPRAGTNEARRRGRLEERSGISAEERTRIKGRNAKAPKSDPSPRSVASFDFNAHPSARPRRGTFGHQGHPKTVPSPHGRKKGIDRLIWQSVADRGRKKRPFSEQKYTLRDSAALLHTDGNERPAAPPKTTLSPARFPAQRASRPSRMCWYAESTPKVRRKYAAAEARGVGIAVEKGDS
jgi:hypothetical protein